MILKFCRLVAVALVVAGAVALPADAQRRGRRGGNYSVCGDPTARCGAGVPFQPYDLPFRLPVTAVIWESEQFYAVVLKSMRVRDDFDECELHVPESERLDAQKLFPRNKVFASRCQEPGTLYYMNTAPGQRFMAVYAGRTRAEAARVLARVKETGKFPGANLRRMRVGFNGT
jgi:hypothetical protein